MWVQFNVSGFSGFRVLTEMDKIPEDATHGWWVAFSYDNNRVIQELKEIAAENAWSLDEWSSGRFPRDCKLVVLMR